jgi:hypothetical protein
VHLGKGGSDIDIQIGEAVPEPTELEVLNIKVSILGRHGPERAKKFCVKVAGKKCARCEPVRP